MTDFLSLFVLLSQIKDAVTLCEYFAWIEQNISTGTITEVSAAEKLEKIKRYTFA